MAFTSAALWAWSRHKPVLAGTMIGLGTAAKLYPVFLLVALLILAWRTRRWSGFGWASAAAAASWAAVNVPIALAYHQGWWAFYQFSTEYPGRFEWTYEKAGPEVWQVKIDRIAA